MLAVIATQGAAPATQPNQNGSIVVRVRPGGFISSCNQPNRIIATLAPAMPMSALSPVMPVYAQISNTMMVELIEYSSQRNRLRPRRRSSS